MFSALNFITQKNSKTLLISRIDQTKAFELETETEVKGFYVFEASY